MNAGISGTERGNILFFKQTVRNLYGSINEFEKGSQPRNNLVKDERLTCVHTQCNI
jgi:hypothetical protein